MNTTEKIDINELYKKYENEKWRGNILGYIVYKRTYARLIADGSRTEEWNETVQRVISSIKKYNFKIDDDELIRLYDYMYNLKGSVSGRGLWQLGSKTVEKYGGDSLVNCFAGETEIITSNGIKQIKDSIGSVSLMTEYGKYVDSEIKNFGKQALYKLLLVKGNSKKEIFVTNNHRWFREPRRTNDERNTHSKVETITADLKKGDRLISIFGQSIKNIKEISYYGICHGIVYGDGSVNYSDNSTYIRLCGGKNKELLQYFLHPNATEYETDIVIHNLPLYFKEKPTLNMDKSYLYGFLAGYLATDGNVKYNDGTVRINSAKKENLFLVRDICVKLGIGYTPITVQNRLGIDNKYSDLYNININGSDLTDDFFLISTHKNEFKNHNYMSNRNWKVENIEKTDRFEDVYCAVVPDTHSFVLEGNILTGNCWGTLIQEVEDFTFVMEELMLGGGLGFPVKREYIHQLPKIKEDIKVWREDTKDASFIVPDTREGWVELLRRVLLAFLNGGTSFSYSLMLIRSKGALIKGFGGVSSGPEELHIGIQNIVKVFQNREGKRLRSIDALDILNIIGQIVVSGNVRRSAEVAIGDPDDILFLRAKRWDLGNIPSWRAMSNNSNAVDDYDEILPEFWEGYAGKGEPYGLFNLRLSKMMGRLGEKRKDNSIEIGNPCMEIGLGNKEPCNLTEIYLPNISSYNELIDLATILYKYSKNVANLNYINSDTNKIVHKNNKLGISVTGICESTAEQLSWLDNAYKSLRETDKEYSAKYGWNESIRITTVKPSGTLSLLGNVTPGVHPAYSQYYIRRVRMSANDSLIELCKNAGLDIEPQVDLDGTIDRNTMIVNFPIKSKDNAILAKDMTAITQLELVKKMQTIWADNAVSCTVYYNPEELVTIKEWLKENYKSSLKSVSFLLHSEHGFKQAPYEEITKEQYDKLTKKINFDKLYRKAQNSMDLVDSLECEGGACPVR